jgi:hypothetical protein
MNSEHTDPHRPVVTTTEARGGVTGQNVRYVLLYGLFGAVAVFAILYFVFFYQYA